jgi:hypothetical protein
MGRCPTHPRYKAIRKPRVACEACWAKWFWEEKLRSMGGHEGALKSIGLDKDSMAEWSRMNDEWINSPG